MELYELNPYIRYCSQLPKPWASPFPVKAYDCRLYYVFSGKGSYRIQDRIYPIEEDTIIFIPSGMTYQLRYENKEPFSLMILNFDMTQEKRSVTDSMEPSFCRDFKEENWIRTPSLFDKPIVISAPSVKEYMENILAEFAAKKPNYAEYGSTLLRLVLIEMFKMTSVGKTEARLTHKITQYVCDHFGENITIDSLAEYLNYNAKYINRVFRKETGSSIHQFILKYRVQRSQRLLQKTELSITEIASFCGFSSQTHFSSVFSKTVGLTPSEYRKQKGQKNI